MADSLKHKEQTGGLEVQLPPLHGIPRVKNTVDKTPKLKIKSYTMHEKKMATVKKKETYCNKTLTNIKPLHSTNPLWSMHYLKINTPQTSHR